MVTVGVDKARNQLSGLLRRVAKGERVIITKHGIPMATLVPADRASPRSIEETVDAMFKHRKKTRVRGLAACGLIDEGRR